MTQMDYADEIHPQITRITQMYLSSILLDARLLTGWMARRVYGRPQESVIADSADGVMSRSLLDARLLTADRRPRSMQERQRLRDSAR